MSNLFKGIFIWVVVSASGFAMASTSIPSLEGQYFGRVKYEGRSRSVGLLMNPIVEEPGSYYGIVMEYLSYTREKGFIANFLRAGKKKWFRKKQNGYLQQLLNWIQIYKFVPIEGTRKYKLHPLKVENGKILSLEAISNFELRLSDRKNKPLKGSRLHLKLGSQNMNLKLRTKHRFPLKSTWEYEYVPGPYNPGYKQAKDTILTLNPNMQKNERTGIKSATTYFNVMELDNKPTRIEGDYDIVEAYRGMFVFQDADRSAGIGAEKIEDKIGVFIDIYNGQPLFKTVELVLIDPANHKTSQMYFEKVGNKVQNGDPMPVNN